MGFEPTLKDLGSALKWMVKDFELKLMDLGSVLKLMG